MSQSEAVVTQTNSLCYFSVFIKAATRFPAQPTSVNVSPQQRAGTVFRITEAIVQHIKDCQTDVEADEVCELQWAHRMVHTEFHDAINTFTRSNAFVKSKNRLVDHRQQNAGRNKAL